ncbi:MAG: glycosyltransferase family 9 protein [Candidatus Eisenbacteria bacterium]
MKRSDTARGTPLWRAEPGRRPRSISISIAPIGTGIGDLLVSLPALQGSIDAGFRTYLRPLSAVQVEIAARVAGLQGIDSQTGGPRRVPRPVVVRLRDHPLQSEFWWGSPEFESRYGAIGIDEIVSRIAADLGLPPPVPDRLVPLRAGRAPDPSLRRTILLLPSSDAGYKLWSSARWIELARMLAGGATAPPSARGVAPRGAPRQVAVVGPGDRREVTALRERGIPWLETPAIGDAIDALSSCAGVVSVDSGLFHIAVQQGRPAVGLFRRPSLFRRSAPLARNCVAAACDPACLSRDFARAARGREVEPASPGDGLAPDEPPASVWRCERLEEERCMAGITVAQVLDALHDLDLW